MGYVRDMFKPRNVELSGTFLRCGWGQEKCEVVGGSWYRRNCLNLPQRLGCPNGWYSSQLEDDDFFPPEMYTIGAIARFIKSPDCAGLLVHLVFQNSWSSGLASSEDIAVLRCFACFHIILRGDQTRTPQNKQWTTVWLAATCCSAYAGLLAQCCCLSRLWLWQTGSSADGKKKQQQSNKWTAFGAPKGVENPPNWYPAELMRTLLANC